MTPWADRGVLLLNACLTVREHQANSHAGHGWETFTTEVLRAVSKSTKGVVFLAWGSPAQKRVDSIGLDKSKHCILRSVHPSPLSAARGFFECQHFIKTNQWLRDRYGVEGEVEWDCLAEGKQGRGLPPNDSAGPKTVNTNPTAAKERKEEVKDRLNGNASKMSQAAAMDTAEEDVTLEDAYEIDESDLVGIP